MTSNLFTFICETMALHFLCDIKIAKKLKQTGKQNEDDLSEKQKNEAIDEAIKLLKNDWETAMHVLELTRRGLHTKEGVAIYIRRHS